MEDLEHLNEILKDIDKLCISIKKETLRVMKIIQSEGEEIAKDIQQEKLHIDVNTIITMLQNTSISLCEDANKIAHELNVFSVVLATGKNIKECDCESLKEVWYGDAYDGNRKLKGLQALKRDLENQLEQICLETVIERVMNLTSPNLEQ